jgi:hypothetical protein
MLKRFLHWLDVTRMEWRMRRLYEARPLDFVRTRQWFDVGREISPAEAYDQLTCFVREVVASSRRPYGKGAYGFVLAAIWEGERDDRWETTFTYEGRKAFFSQLAARLEGWSLPPLAVMVGVLLYGDLALAADS